MKKRFLLLAVAMSLAIPVESMDSTKTGGVYEFTCRDNRERQPNNDKSEFQRIYQGSVGVDKCIDLIMQLGGGLTICHTSGLWSEGGPSQNISDNLYVNVFGKGFCTGVRAYPTDVVAFTVDDIPTLSEFDSYYTTSPLGYKAKVASFDRQTSAWSLANETSLQEVLWPVYNTAKQSSPSSQQNIPVMYAVAYYKRNRADYYLFLLNEGCVAGTDVLDLINNGQGSFSYIKPELHKLLRTNQPATVKPATVNEK